MNQYQQSQTKIHNFKNFVLFYPTLSTIINLFFFLCIYIYTIAHTFKGYQQITVITIHNFFSFFGEDFT